MSNLIWKYTIKTKQIDYGTQKSQVNMNLNYFMYFGTQID